VSASEDQLHSKLDFAIGSDGIRFWNLSTYTEIPAPYHTRLLDPVSRAVWLTLGDDSFPILCYATGLGYLVFCKKHAEEVSTLSMRHG
jgi:hypothetical protein